MKIYINKIMKHSRVGRKLLLKLPEPEFFKAKLQCPDVRWKGKPWSKSWKWGSNIVQQREEVDR